MTTEASCTEPGLKTFTCEFCGEELSTEEIPAAGHTPGEPETTKRATLFSDGKEAVRCIVCGETLEMSAVPMETNLKVRYAILYAVMILSAAALIVYLVRKHKKVTE